MELLSAKDLPYIKITDFMAAIGRKPIRKDGNLIVYEAPYNCAHLYREYGIETKDKPTCVVDTVSNSWYDSKNKSYNLWGDLPQLAGAMFDSYDNEFRTRYLLDVMNDYIRKNTIRLNPIPRVKFENQGNVLCMVFTPKEVSLKEFLIEEGYVTIKTEGNLSYYSYYGRWGKDRHPDVVVDNQKDLWIEPQSGNKLGLSDLVSTITGEESRSDILWYIGEVLSGKEIVKEFWPEGMKIEPAQQKLNMPSHDEVAVQPKRKMRL